MSIDQSTIIPTLAVTDIERAREFYGTTLGLQDEGSGVPDTNDNVYRVGDGYLYIYERAEPSGSTATAFSFAVDDVRRTVERLRDKGVTFEEYDIPEMGLKTEDGIAQEGELETAWFTDPSGNILAIDNALKVLTERKSKGRSEELEPA